MFSKIIFIGLPGAGKSTAAAQLAERHNITLYSSDAKIKEILNAYKNKTMEPKSLCYEKLMDLKIQFTNKGFDSATVERAFQREGYDKHSTAFMSILGESYWRQVEAEIAALLINEHPECMFDLGASQVLNDSVRKAIQDNGFYLIHLDADEAAIEHHLLTPQSDGKPRWQLISNYQNAGEQWRLLAQEHRKIRKPQYANIADETITVHKNTSIDHIIDEAEQWVSAMNAYKPK